MTKTINWAAAVDGDFADAADWIGGAAPTRREIANLQSFGGSPYTVTFDTPPGGRRGKRPTAIAELDIGDSVTLNVEDNLNVGLFHAGVTPDGQITNEGTFSITTRIGVLFSTTFTNTGLVEVANEGAILGEGLNPELINNGQILLSNDGQIGQLAEFENDGTLSGSGTTEVSEIVNNGTIYGGNLPNFYSGLLLSSVVNNGLVEATNGNTINAFGDFTGSGVILIDGGTFLAEHDGGGIFSADITFGRSASSTFILGDRQGEGHGALTYTGTISGFSKKGHSTLDLQDMVGTGSAEATYAGTNKGGILTVTGDGHSDTIAFAGNYLGVTFTATMTAAGTTVTASTSGAATPPSVSGLAQAMARFAAPAPHMTAPQIHSVTQQADLALGSNQRTRLISLV